MNTGINNDDGSLKAWLDHVRERLEAQRPHVHYQWCNARNCEKFRDDINRASGEF